MEMFTSVNYVLMKVFDILGLACLACFSFYRKICHLRFNLFYFLQKLNAVLFSHHVELLNCKNVIRWSVS